MFKLMQNVQKCQRKPPDVEEWGGIEVDQAVEGTGHLINLIHLVEDAGHIEVDQVHLMVEDTGHRNQSLGLKPTV